MADYRLTRFDRYDALEDRAYALLTGAFTAANNRPTAVLLTGGNTPRRLYGRVAEAGISAASNLHVMLSDERHVPLGDAASNWRMIQPMLRFIKLPPSRALHVDTTLPLEEAAERYDHALAAFFSAGGRLSLVLLGLGADGHVASLFSPDDIRRASHGHAVAIRRPEPPHRISVTPRVLQHGAQVVFMTAGPEKQDAVQALLDNPLSIPAGMALRGCERVDIWASREPAP